MIKAEKVRGSDGSWWICLSFKRQPNITATILTIPEVEYSKQYDKYMVPYYKRGEIERKLGQYLIDWVDEPVPYNGGIPETEFSEYPILDGYSLEYEDGKVVSHEGFKVPPWADFQMRGVNAILQKDRLILADEMGLGKTYQASVGVSMRMDEGLSSKCLILAKASLVYMWRDEIKKFTDKEVVVMTGTPKQRHHIYKQMIDKEIEWDFLIMGYEMFRKNVPMINSLDNIFIVDTVIMDEAHKIKNPLSSIGERVGFVPFENVYLLTATPILNSPLESFNYLRMCKDLPPGLKGNYVSNQYYHFRNRYGIMGGYDNREVVGYKNMDDIRIRLQRNMLRRTKKEKLKDLPEVTFSTIQLDMTPPQKRLYRAIVNEIKEDLAETDLVKIPTMLAKLTRLQQVTGSPRLIGGDDSKSAKEKALDDLIEDIVDEGGGKVVIFTKFRTLLEILVDRYKDYNPAVIHGEVSSQALPLDLAKEKAIKQVGGIDKWRELNTEEQEQYLYDYTTSARQKEVDRFQKDHRCRIFLGTTEACKEGLTLTASSNVIFLDYPWNWASYSQAYARTHRIGQTQAVTVYNLICTGTVDEKVFNIIKEKKSLTEVLIDTNVADKELQGMSAEMFINNMIN